MNKSFLECRFHELIHSFSTMWRTGYREKARINPEQTNPDLERHINNLDRVRGTAVKSSVPGSWLDKSDSSLCYLLAVWNWLSHSASRSLIVFICEKTIFIDLIGLLWGFKEFSHLTRWQSNAQNSPSLASAVREPGTSRYSSWF